MRIVSIGGGPAGLYFSILAKRADPTREVVVLERNRPGDTFGFGVVFSDRTLDNLARADGPTQRAIVEAFAHWDDIDVHWKGEVIRSRGHGFAGLERTRLLAILTDRARELGCDVRFGEEVGDPRAVAAGADLVLGADGVNSAVRAVYAAELAPAIDTRPNRFVWLGTTFPFPAFTFYFKEDAAGLWRVHAYRYAEGHSTFIVECTDETWRASGMDAADEDQTIAYLERLFARELAGYRLQKNRSLWRAFPTISCARWSVGNVVLVGDAAHTAHFSIGSGTKLALEDAIALHDAIQRTPDVERALAAYEAERRPAVASTQRAAQVSLEWFENTERYRDLPPLPFTFSLLTRSLRVTHGNLALRDPELVARVDRELAAEAGADGVPPPMFTPYTVRGVRLQNRVVVSPMCMYSAVDGTINDWHLVHLGSRAIGGAGLVFTEATAVAAEGRITPGDAGMYSEEHVRAWSRVVAFVKERSRARIGMQLAHAGRKASTVPPWDGGRPLAEPEGAWQVVAPSAIPFAPGWGMPVALDGRAMAQVRDDFVRAARRALVAGFDVLELHYAHGYLMAEFLSPLTNRRTDEHGGPLTNRLRFPREVVTAVREAWGDRPLFVRISASDWAPGGIAPDETVAIARALVAAGADLIDVSSGGTVAEARPAGGRLYQTPLSDRIRHEAGVPTMTVGGVSSWDDVNSVIAARRADLVALAREHLFDPYFTRHAAAAQRQPQWWPDPYVWSMARYDPPRR